jgi:hypothetical protein
MKKMKFWMMAAILFCGLGCMISCAPNKTVEKNAEKPMVDVQQLVDKYMVDSIGSQYSQGEVCIPCAIIVACNNEPEVDTVRVLGDFWVFNYNIVGDTLKCVSGGDHPGLMLFVRDAIGDLKFLSFEQVEDGSGNLASAKRIFGDMYMAFQSINSDKETVEDGRSHFIADYVKKHNLPVKYYQDYGWPAREIPFE